MNKKSILILLILISFSIIKAEKPKLFIGATAHIGNGKVIVLQVQTSKDDDDIRFKVADIIKLPIRNVTAAG